MIAAAVPDRWRGGSDSVAHRRGLNHDQRDIRVRRA